jgi:hypothetical protein
MLPGQLDLGFPEEEPKKLGLSWRRLGPPGKIGAAYRLCWDGNPADVFVKHCGHPTANYLYWIEVDGQMHLCNGRGFLNLKHAQEAAFHLWKGTRAEQRPLDIGLFDEEARNQGDLVDAVRSKRAR